MDTLIENIDQPLVAFGRTIEMVLMAGVLALVVGLFLAALRVSPNAAKSVVATEAVVSQG